MKKRIKNIGLTILEGLIAFALVISFTASALIAVIWGVVMFMVQEAASYKKPWEEVLKDEIDLTLSNGVLIEYTESHRGFFGEGVTYICVDVSTSNLSVEGTHGWNELPMTENIHTVLYGSETHGALKESFEFALPDSENGYYYFYNKQSDSYTDDGLLGQASYNFKFALYDTDEMKLYFIEFDT